ncbi:MAG TPA: ATP-binding cassette domain-containing protein, partial [Burkholderiales bacterium]|nr:ATP-binding cassette domain-containing protein [Burkholderiales bacterium]
MLGLERVNVRYGKNHVLKDVTISIAAGEVVSLIGANAAGKTTTLRAVMGLKEAAAGSLLFAGEDITRLATYERVNRGLVLVPEGRRVFTKFTVVENLLMGAYHRAD